MIILNRPLYEKRLTLAREIKSINQHRIALYIELGFIDLTKVYDNEYLKTLAKEWGWNRSVFCRELHEVVG